MNLPAARARVEALRAALQAGNRAPLRLIETHISWVLLADELAYKFKKPLRLPFLDFSTLAARRRCCDEELRLNRRLAPDLYLDVLEVRASANGPVFGGDGDVLDVALRMRRFPDGALWSEHAAAGTLKAPQIDAMARTLTAFHASAAVAPAGSPHGLADAQGFINRRLVEGLDRWQAGGGARISRADWPALRTWLDGQLVALAPLWRARQQRGRVRECHGDLHLANVIQLGEQATAFDGIEFDEALRWIDVLDDLAFLAMDLMAHGLQPLAWRLINACLEASGDHDGLPTLRFYLVSRALVRAQVGAIGEAQGATPVPGRDAVAYLELAASLAFGADARLAITHGLPGSGKSFVSQGMLEAAGAIRLRSDVERKRLFGLSALQSSRAAVAGGIYERDSTRRTYERLVELARLGLQSGWPVLVDAAFLLRDERRQFEQLAASGGWPWAIVDCRAPLALLHKRLRRRAAEGADASEADGSVLERLRAVDEPLGALEQRVALVADARAASDAGSLARQWLGVAATPAGATTDAAGTG